MKANIPFDPDFDVAPIKETIFDLLTLFVLAGVIYYGFWIHQLSNFVK